MSAPAAVVVAGRRLGLVAVRSAAWWRRRRPVAVVATTAPGWNAPDGYVALAVVAAVAYVVAPDSGGGAVFAGLVTVTWATGGPGGVGPAVVATALALLVGHVAAALAAAMPVGAYAELSLALRWWRPTCVIGVAVVAGSTLVAALDAAALAGSALVTVAAVAVVAAGAWWWTAHD